ncbi:MAG: hypothetical protein ACI837_002109 [Crocinitomicaceae bacterium]|jgi:hypothetical protein
MNKTILFFLIFSANVASSQDTCKLYSTHQYAELTERVTEYCHDTGGLSCRFLKKNENTLIVYRWDSCGRLISKSKSGRTTFKKTYYSKRLSIVYHANESVKRKRFTKMVGCNHIKRSWIKNFSEDGKRLDTISP